MIELISIYYVYKKNNLHPEIIRKILSHKIIFIGNIVMMTIIAARYLSNTA